MTEHIRYTVALPDFEAFLEHELRTTYRRRLLLQGAASGLFLGLAAFLFLYLQLRNQSAAAIVGSLLFFLMLYAMPGVTRDQQRKALRKLFRDQTDSAFGEHTMSLSTDGISVVGANSESTVKWSAIQRISETRQHAFLLLGPLKALIVPLTQLPPDARETFLAELHSRTDERTRRA